MQLSPRYDAGDPIITLDGDAAAVGAPLVRQRRRFAGALRALTPEQWAAPSRCEGWRVQDVVAHLVGTDQFWNLTIGSGLAGAPTRFLARFDPKATPAAMVDAVRESSAAETLAAFVDASESLCATVESLDERGWQAVAESPLGHVSVTAIAHHALWDSWVHERDVLTPLGMVQDEEADEILAALRYVAALAPAFALQSSTAAGGGGSLALDVTAPDARIVVTVDDSVHVADGGAPAGALVLTGDAVELLDVLSVRAPLQQAVPDDQAWLVSGLADVFESSTLG